MGNKKVPRITGRKGGDEQRTPTEAVDSLRSKQIAQLTDIVSEGEIVGLRHGMRSVYLNETPLQNVDGTFNFKDVAVQYRLGTVSQTPFEGVTASEFEVPVGTEVVYATPITRTINTANLTAVRVTLGFPSLTKQDAKTGDLNGVSVHIKIQVQTDGGGFVDKITDIVSGKTTSRYQRAYKIGLTGDGPWDVRVIRVSPDSNTIMIQDKLVFDSYTGLIEAKLSYPNSALMNVRVDAANFSSIPTRAYHIRGIVMKVPTNYNPATRAYSGVWDGTFKNEWTDNPAWCFYDMLTNTRYGLGQFVSVDAIDKWSLYSIAKYCDALVPDGRGGTEPRFTCNLYLQSREDAYRVVQNMASIFRAITFWSNGTVTGMQDRPSDPIAQFTNANVVDGEFIYSGSSLKQRHTVALIAWNDPTDFYRQKIEYVQEDADVAQFGIIETEVAAFGCSSQGQAHRMGRWMLATERFATETISFKSGLDGCNLYPGAVFQTSDLIRAGKRVAGRVLAHMPGTPTGIKLDAPITFTMGHTYTVCVMLPSGVLETRTVYTAPNGLVKDELLLTVPLSETPQEGAVWVLVDQASLVPELWRVVSITEGANSSVEVNALRYEPGLYDNVENGVVIPPRPVSSINTRPPMPTNLTIAVSHYRVSDQITGLRVLFSWTSNVGKYRVTWRKQDGQAVMREVLETSIEINTMDTGIYEFTVAAVSATGRISATASITEDLTELAEGAIDFLPAPEDLELEVPYESETAQIKWSQVPGALFYEVQVGRPIAPDPDPEVDNFVPIRTDRVGVATRYAYSPENMRADGGPFRTLRFRVRAIGAFAKQGLWAELDAGNPQVGMLEGIDIRLGIRIVYFRCDHPDDDDFDGIRLHASTDPDFVPALENKVYEGFGTFGSFNTQADGTPFETGLTYFLRATGFDKLGKDELTYTPAIPFEPLANAPDLDTIIADMIQDGALTATKFASGLEPVGLVETLPNPVGYTGPKIVAVTSEDGKLYTYIDGAWTSSVPAVTPGSIEITDLVPGLQDEIALISLPDGYAGSVSSRIATGIATETTNRTNAINALASTVTGLNAAWNADIAANILTYDGTVASQFSAMATQINGLSATWNNDIDASIDTYAQTVTSALGAQATTISTLNSTVEGHSTTIGQSATSINGLQARVEVKIDNNGVISGYALDSVTSRTGAPTSTMKFAVDTFQIVSTGVAPTAVFEVSTKAGQQAITLSGARIKDGTITAETIAANAITSDKITANAITTGKIAAGAITATQIAAGAITTDTLVVGINGGIPGTMIQNGAISTAKLIAGSVTGDKILGNSITGDKIVANTITASHIDSRGLSIMDGAGNIILAAGTGLNYATYVTNKPTSLAAINSGESTKLNSVASGATRNIITTGASAPIGPNNGDTWVDTSSNPVVTKQYIAGAWVVGANNTTNTTQLADGAGLGTMALWTGVTGANKPADLATRNTGAFANLSGTITAANAATYFAANSLAGTYIANLAADKITAGTLVAGVIYAGAINASQVTAGTFTGRTFQTAASGTRVLIDAATNKIQFYSGVTVVAEMGGSSGNVYASAAGFIPGIWATTSSGGAAINAISTAGGYSLYASNSGGTAIYVNGSSGFTSVKLSNTNGTALEVDGILTTIAYSEVSNKSARTNNILPVTDNAYNCGTLAKRWMGMTSASAVVVSSDERLKTDIEPSDLGLEFINALNPVSYTMLEGRTEISHAPEQVGPWPNGTQPDKVIIETPVPGTRRHYGLIAQQVKAVLGSRDAAFWILEDKDNPDSSQALRYEELIAPLIRAVQELSAEVVALKARVGELES